MTNLGVKLYHRRVCTGILHFITLYDTAFFFLNKWKIHGNPAVSKSIGTICPTAFAHFVSLCHILVILTIFQFYYYYYISYDVL